MPDRAPMLYLAAFLHDLGKVFGKPPEGHSPPPETHLLEEWRRAHCPPTCSRGENRCPVAYHGEHAMRCAVYLLARGLPSELREVAALILSHHGHVAGKKMLCPDLFASLSERIGCPIEPEGRAVLSDELAALQRLLRVADQIASSASRVELADRPFSDVRCSPFWATFRTTFEAVPIGRRVSFRGKLFQDWGRLQRLLDDNNFFSAAWEAFRRELTDEFQSVMEARHGSPDVGLWSHSAFTAATALCYYRRQGEAPDFPTDGTKTRSGLAVACLAFMGSERVTEVPSDGALRQVRGRAALLSLLSSSFACTLLHALGLPPECLLLKWDAGCFLLLPDTVGETLTVVTTAMIEEFRRFPHIASVRLSLAPVYVVRQKGLTLYLREAMHQAWDLAVYGHKEEECELIWGERPRGQIGLAGASRCGVCGTPFPHPEELCPRCQEVERIGIAINQGQFKDCGLHLVPKKASPPDDAVYRLEALGVYVASGGWPWQPPVGPGSPQQLLERQASDQGAKAKIGIALVRCEAVEWLFSKMNEQHLLPARLAECFRLAEQFFRSLHREEEDLWALRWSPAEVLLMGRAHSTLKALAELPELCKTFLGFGPQEMGLKAALAVCPFDSPWREAVEALRAVIHQIRPGERWQVFLTESTPVDPGLVLALLGYAREAGQDGKFALDALQISLSAGRAQWGHGARSEYNAVKASNELMLLEARASGHRRQTLTKMRQLLSEQTRQGLLDALAGAAPPPEMSSWLAGKGPEDINSIMASLGLARRLLAD